MTIDDIKYGYYFYFYFFFKYFSWKKFINFLKALGEYMLKKEKVASFPFIASIDPANTCVLKCPLCPTGRDDPGVKKKILAFEEFKKYFDEIKDYLFLVRLYNWGEPFLAKDIFKMIDYVHQNHVGVVVNSNLNVQPVNFAQKVIESKLDYLMISIDGVTQKKYETYRKGGNLKKVLGAVKKINRMKKRLKSKWPIIHWSYLVNRYNTGEINQARKIAHKIGVNLITFSRLSLVTKIGDKVSLKNKEFWLGEDIKSQRGESKPPAACYFLWTSVNISPNGEIFPCCGVYEDKYNFGSLKKKSFIQIWNNPQFVSARSLFRQKQTSKIYTICSQCDWFRKS